MKTNFEQMAKEWIEFSIPTFKDATALDSLKKLSHEANEVAAEMDNDVFGHHDPENLHAEYADCFMCLLDSMARNNITIDQLNMAFRKKIDKNKSRTWKRNKDGTYSHVKTN